MVKTVLTLLLMIIVSKAIFENANSGYNDSIVKAAILEEESKNEKEDNSKRHIDEMDYNNPAHHAFEPYTLTLPSYLLNQNPYNQFVNTLITPPPDLT